MKGREYKALQRSNKRFKADPIVRCKCGEPYPNGIMDRLCPWKRCIMGFCRKCKRIIASIGPIECPCDRGGQGHGRYEELPKPKSSKFRKK